MKIKDSNEIEQLIELLDFQIYAGLSHSVGIKVQYNEQKDAPEFAIDPYVQEATRTLEMWKNGVVELIHLKLGPTSHFLYFFVKAPQIAFKYNGMPENLSNLIVMFEKHLEALENIVMRLEEREGLLIRQEIAKQERDASTLYEVTYIGREIRINDIYLSKPDFMSENELFFSYIFERPWSKIKIADMLAELQLPKFKKSVSQMLSDLRFTGNVRQIFCPDASSNGIIFRNPISRGFADENNISTLDFSRNDKK